MNGSQPTASQPSLFRKILPGLLLGLAALVVLSLIGDLRQVGALMVRFNGWMFPLAIGFTLFNYALRFLKWHFYIHQIGGEGLSWKESLRLFVAGFPLAVSPGKVAEVLKAVWLSEATGITVAKGVSVVVAERISDGLAVLLLSTLGVIAYPQYWPAFAIVMAGLVGVIILAQFRPVVLWILNQGERIVLFSRMISLLREFYEGSFLLFKPKATVVAVLLGMISWFGEGIGFYLILLGLGVQPSITVFGLAVFILAFSTVIGAVSTLPGGLGAAEASIAGMLALLGGMEPALAAAATLLIRLATFWLSVALGIGTWVISPRLTGLREGK